MTSERLARDVASVAASKKAEDIVVLRMDEAVSYTDFFVVISGANTRQTKAIANEIQAKLRPEWRPARVEGDPTALLSADYKPRLPLRELLQQGLGAAGETEQIGDRPAVLIDLVAPSQPTEYWIAFDNFYVITRYNHSTFYAMAVFQLAQALRAERSRTTE